jgi:hypothetical protein
MFKKVLLSVAAIAIVPVSIFVAYNYANTKNTVAENPVPEIAQMKCSTSGCTMYCHKKPDGYYCTYCSGHCWLRHNDANDGIEVAICPVHDNMATENPAPEIAQMKCSTSGCTMYCHKKPDGYYCSYCSGHCWLRHNEANENTEMAVCPVHSPVVGK